VKTLYLIGQLLLTGFLMPLEFNSSLSVFAPKGTDKDDTAYCCTREPSETRPLALKNSDNKTICAVVNRSLKYVAAKFLNHVQRGFTYGRQLLRNVTDLDVEARLQSMCSPRTDYPLLCFYDFAAAFPSVLHAWIGFVFEKMAAPEGLRKLIFVIYFMHITYGSFGGTLVILFQICSGVLQGCPLSGLIFAIVADPGMSAFDEAINKSKVGCVRACADDVGAALKTIWGLLPMKDIFDDLEACAGLTLKPKKCVIVPTGEPLSQQVVDFIKGFLNEFLPQWAAFKVASNSTYLGFFMGPDVSEQA